MNVRDYGAVGDGIRDDTAAIQAALDAAAQGDDPTVWFSRGRYMVRTLRIPSHVTLMGHASWGYMSPMTTSPGRTPDPLGAGQTVIAALTAEEEALLDARDTDGVRIIGLGLDGSNLGDTLKGPIGLGLSIYNPQNRLCGIAADDARDIVMEDIRMQGFRNTCIRLHRTDGFALRRSLLFRNRSHGLDISGSRRGAVMDCQLAYNGGAGLYGAGDVDGVTVTANRIEGGHPGGIYLDGARGAVISGNAFDACRGPAVTLLHCEGASVTGSDSRHVGMEQTGDSSCHFRLEHCRGLTVANNILWKWFDAADNPNLCSYGMVLRDLEASVVAHNSMPDAAVFELIRDYGGHRSCRIEMNCGQTFGTKNIEEQ